MAAPTTADDFLELVRKSGVLDEKRLSAYLEKVGATGGLPPEPAKAAGLLVRDGLLTHFQAEQFLQGKWRRFTIGKYKVLERIASGGMGSVYLCEHKFMRRRAAVKVLPTARANDPSALERFYREARAVAALDHPNIVRAYDIDQEENLHFLVMEYVDGTSLQDLVKNSGPLDPARAAHYISQAAQGLQHAHEIAGLVHRDIKPGNLIVDRGGVVKILDMGLARFFNDHEDLLTQKYDENVLGTADYLAPEQALDSHGVDIRADIYSLGATFYYCLTGRTPFSEGTVAQKLIWHQTRQPKLIRSLRQDVPESMSAVVEKMMAKDPEQRYQIPAEVVQALARWTQASIAPPVEAEMPQLSLAATSANSSEGTAGPKSPPPSAGQAANARKPWDFPSGPVSPKPQAKRPPSNPPLNRTEPSSRLAPAAPTVVAKPEEAPPTTMIASSDAGLTKNDLAFTVAPPITTSNHEDDSLPWENLAKDTAEHAKHADTQAPVPKPASAKQMRPNHVSRMPDAERQRLVRVVTIVSIVVLLVLTLLIWVAFWGEGQQTVSKDNKKKAPASTKWIVSRAGQANAVKSIQEALARAQPNDHIIVTDDEIAEQVSVSGKQFVTLESAPGKIVVWRYPEKADSKHLLYLDNAEGVCVQGFTLDGRDKVDEIVQLFGECPGLILQDLHLRGFKRFGIQGINCAGKSGSPAKLLDLQISTTKETEAALGFTAYTNVTSQVPRLNQFLTVRGCRFDGPYKDIVARSPGPAALANLTWEDNSARPSSDKPYVLVPAPK
jgi:eukaryotic-like serine/threonine-protein kinase